MRQYTCLFAFLVLSSCVTNKKVQLLQNEETDKDHEVNEVINNYDLITDYYKIRANDVLSIEIESLTRPEFNFFSLEQGNSNFGNISAENAPITGEMVDPKGFVEFPVVGKIKVGGLTLDEIQEKIREVASKYVTDPVVKIRLLNFRFTILGEITNVGTISTFNQPVSILEAVGLAGGMTDLADRSNVKLVRGHEGEASVIYLDLLDENFVSSPYYYLHQNDILIIPPLKQRPFRVSFGANLALVLSTISTLLLVINFIQN